MNSALTIQNPKGTGDDLPSGTVGNPYSTNLTASGGSGVYRWELPNRPSVFSWLVLDKNTGTLSGTPDAPTPGSVQLTVTVTDSNDATAQRPLPLTINPRVSGNGGPPVLTIQAAE